MAILKHWKLSAVMVVALLLLSSCGSPAGSTSNTAPTSPPTAPTTPPATPTPASTVTVKTTSLTVGGKTVTALTDARGYTLYYYIPDTSQKTACTGACAQNWPPLLFSGTGKVTAASKLPGELEVYKNDNGSQVIYNDHPLYTYVGDTAPAQVNGEGKFGKWHVATTDLTKNA